MRWLKWMCLLVLATFCWGTATVTAASEFGDRVANMVKITGIRVGATSSRVRIVVDASKPLEYKRMVLSQPGRIVIDVQNAWIDPNITRETPIGSRFASRVYVAQFDPQTVRIVVQTEVKKENYDIFALSGGNVPYRVVMDFGKVGTGTAEYGDDGETINTAARTKSVTTADGLEKPAEVDVAKQEAKADKNKAEDEKPLPQGPKFTPGLKGKKICLDPGHGGIDPGAIGPSGITEKGITLRIALALKKSLEESGAKVIMTRTADKDVSPKGEHASDVEELQARCDIANKAKADIFVCIHMDSFTSKNASGTTGYYFARGTATGRRLAKLVQDGVVAQLKTTGRGPKSCNFYVVKHTDMPATLVEIAFLSNPREEKLMNSQAGVEKAAKGIQNGIAAFFKNG